MSAAANQEALLGHVVEVLQRAGVRPPVAPDVSFERAGIHSIQALVALAELQRRLGLGSSVLERLVALGRPLGQHTPAGVAEILASLGVRAGPP